MAWILALCMFFSIILIIYHHVGYPWLMAHYARKYPPQPLKLKQRCYQRQRQDDALPTITLIMPAYNEAAWIQAKIDNLACLDYPKSRLKMVIACDGCSDNTAELARNALAKPLCCERPFQLQEYHENRGKVAVLNDIILQQKSDLIVLTDVSSLISIDALLVAAQRFTDAEMGVVNAQYRLWDKTHCGEASYWDYQTQIKQGEAALGATLGAHGACFVFRRHLFQALPDHTINDDFVLPMRIVTQGYKACYETNIVALELESTRLQQDFQRRLRISAGNMQQLIDLRSIFSPRKWFKPQSWRLTFLMFS